ncbi:MAG: hypothetical protein U0893_01180 [Chloroflexota bacterium]
MRRATGKKRFGRSGRHALVPALLALLAVLLLAPLASGPAVAQSAAWIATFDGRPASPLPFNPATWDVQVHSRDVSTWTQLEPIAAHHGASCSAPPDTHVTSSYEGAVFQCNDHVMTAIAAGGYGLVALTPDHMVDFRNGEAVVRFDMSTFRSSLRDWVSIWLSPWDDQIPLPLEEWLPDGVGKPRRGVHVRMDIANGGLSFFRGATIASFQGTGLPIDDTPYESFLTPSATRRDQFELRISRTSLKFGMPAYNRWWIDTTFPDLGWDRAVLQLEHHSYNPSKCDGCTPNTWHWDNVSISQSVPFVMLKADLPWVSPATRRWVTFPGPAPANSSLRFVGIGDSLQVSFNGGQSWQNAVPHPVEIAPGDHLRPFWMPVPTGTTRVDFRGSGWYGGDWTARGIAIWSQTVPLPPPTSNCATRPRATVTTRALGGGRLLVSVQVGRPATAPANIVRQVRIVRADNAQVDLLGQTFGSGGGTAVPTTASQQVDFVVTRQPANSQAPVTVPFVVTDDCGDWNTFVGGGPTAF